MSALIPAGVRVPGSTSNLGSGFDTLGIAVNRYLEVAFEPGGATLKLERGGTLEGMDTGQEDDRMVRAFRARLRREGLEPLGVLRATSQIPVARGLGSSAAATVAGWSLASLALGGAPDAEGAFRAAAEEEGHGDNAAPCAFGGLRVVVPPVRPTRVLHYPVSQLVGLAYAAPASGVSTREARRVLPDPVARSAAVAAPGRLAALLRGLEMADEELIRLGVADELHVPHRLPLIPGGRDAMEAAVAAGAWAVTISGAGSGLVAVGPKERAATVARAMRDVFGAADDQGEATGWPVDIADEGVASAGPP